MAADWTIRFNQQGSAVVTVPVDRDLAQWLCRQSVHANASVGIVVLRMLRFELLEHARKLAAIAQADAQRAAGQGP